MRLPGAVTVSGTYLVMTEFFEVGSRDVAWSSSCLLGANNLHHLASWRSVSAVGRGDQGLESHGSFRRGWQNMSIEEQSELGNTRAALLALRRRFGSGLTFANKEGISKIGAQDVILQL